MCDLQYHVCPNCGEELNCYQSNTSCPEFNGQRSLPCEQCEYWLAEVEREEERRQKKIRQFADQFDF